MVDFKQEFGKKLKEYRKLAGLTQEQFVEKLNIAVPTLSGFETGKTFPSYPVLCKIIDVLGVTPDTLFTYGMFSDELKDKEQHKLLLKLFNGLDKHHKIIALELIKTLQENQKVN